MVLQPYRGYGTAEQRLCTDRDAYFRVHLTPADQDAEAGEVLLRR